MSAVVPPVVELDGQHHRVRRAWPEVGADGVVHGALVEVVDVAGLVRGGRWSAEGEVEVFAAGVDQDLPVLAQIMAPQGIGDGGVVVSHRPGKRAVLRTREGHWVKVVRRRKERRILEGIKNAEPFAWSFRMPRVLDHADSMVVFEDLAGRSLGDAAAWEPGEWEQAWSEVVMAWVAANSGGSGMIAEGESCHDAAAEVRVIHRWLGQSPEPSLPRGFHDLVGQVETELLTGVAAPLRVSHRDLHDKQVMWDRDLGPGLLDVDTATIAEAALDLGNLRAHARWRALQGAWTSAQTETVLRLIDDAAVRVGCTPERLATYERATLLRLVCVHLHRPADRHLVEDLTDLVRADRRPPRP